MTRNARPTPIPMEPEPILPLRTTIQVFFTDPDRIVRTRSIESWNRLVESWDNCVNCPLHNSRSKIVHFRGFIPCEVLFIGEAPGDQEDALGYPFVGRSGKILNGIINDAIGRTVKHDWTYGITNTVGCRPPRDIENKQLPPTKDEVTACQPRLCDTIAMLTNTGKPPSLVVTLGRIAEKHTTDLLPILNVPYTSLQHPAYVARNGGIGSAAYKRCVLELVAAIKEHKVGLPRR
jgi:uracil-DNA glycosylase family 4